MFNNLQLLAIKNLSDKLVIVSGSGTGKKTVILNKVKFLVHNQKYSQSQILIITFNQNNHQKLKDKLQQLNLDNVLVETCQSISNKLLLYFDRNQEKPKNYNIMSDSNKMQIIYTLCKTNTTSFSQYRSKYLIRDFITSYKEKGLTSDQIPFDIKVDKPSISYNIGIFKKYENYCKNNNKIDSSDVLLINNYLLNKTNCLSNYVNNNFKYIIIDECQNITNLQYKFVLNLCKTSKLCIIGDDDQYIHGRLGVKRNIFNSFIKQFDNSTVIKLEENFRNNKNILEVLNYITSKNKKRYAKTLWTNNTQNNLIELYEAEDEIEEIISVAKSLYKNKSSTAILYINNLQSLLYSIVLSQFGINYNIENKDSFKSFGIIQLVCLYLNFFTYKNTNIKIKQIFKKIVNIKIYTEICTNFKHSKEKKLYQYILHYNGFKDPSYVKFIKLINLIQDHFKNNDIISLINDMITYIKQDKTAFKKKINGCYLHEDIMLIKLAENYNKRLDNKISLQDNIKNFLPLNIFQPNRKSKKNLIELMTLQSSLGKEFDQVFIMALQDNWLPQNINFKTQTKVSIKQIKIASEEANRLLYSIITIIKNSLRLSWSKSNIIYKTTSKNQWDCSNFIKDLIINKKNIIKLNFNADNYYELKNYIKINKKLVIHNEFGIGQIINIFQRKSNVVFYKINFEKNKIKNIKNTDTNFVIYD